MASLTIKIALLESTVSADNTKASNLLAQYAASLGAEGTNQEKMDAVVRGLVEHMKQQGRRHRHNQAATDTAATIKTELDALSWE